MDFDPWPLIVQHLQLAQHPRLFYPSEELLRLPKTVHRQSFSLNFDSMSDKERQRHARKQATYAARKEAAATARAAQVQQLPSKSEADFEKALNTPVRGVGGSISLTLTAKRFNLDKAALIAYVRQKEAEKALAEQPK